MALLAGDLLCRRLLASTLPLPSARRPPPRLAPDPLCLRRSSAPPTLQCESGGGTPSPLAETGGQKVLRTCKNCKSQFDPALNHTTACRYHTAHFGGETRRKFESVYEGGTMNTPDSGKVFQYWHCCGSEDPFDAGCTAAPHCSYDD